MCTDHLTADDQVSLYKYIITQPLRILLSPQKFVPSQVCPLNTSSYLEAKTEGNKDFYSSGWSLSSVKTPLRSPAYAILIFTISINLRH